MVPRIRIQEESRSGKNVKKKTESSGGSTMSHRGGTNLDLLFGNIGVHVAFTSNLTIGVCVAAEVLKPHCPSCRLACNNKGNLKLPVDSVGGILFKILDWYRTDGYYLLKIDCTISPAFQRHYTRLNPLI